MKVSESPREKVLSVMSSMKKGKGCSETGLLRATGLSVPKLNEAIEDLLHEGLISSTENLTRDYFVLSVPNPKPSNVIPLRQ